MTEPKEQELGEWRTNPFLDPQVRKKIAELQNDLREQQLFNHIELKKLKWVEEAYPSIIEQYEAIKAIEAAEYEAKHKFFGEIK